MRSESEVQVPKYGFLGNSGCKVGITNTIAQLVQNPSPEIPMVFSKSPT